MRQASTSLSETDLKGGAQMRRKSVGLIVAVVGVFVSWIGQGILRDSLDTIWATVAILSVLSGLAIAMHPTIFRLLAPLTGAPKEPNAPLS